MRNLKSLDQLILIESRSYHSHFHYRFDYSTYIMFDDDTLNKDKEGEQIVYRTPNKIKKILLNGHYHSLDRLSNKCHDRKAAVLAEIIKKRKTKNWLDNEYK